MRALISGVAGQDGSYLADILLERGYEVYGLYRHSSKDPFDNVRHNLSNLNFHLIQGDVTDALCLDEIIRKVDPHHIYHEADQDNVDWSFVHPAYQVDVTVKAVSNLLSSVRRHCPSARVFIPCSATMFGDAPAPQTESSPFNPLSPYACAKVAAYHLARMYRQNYGMFVCTGILYNHDSPRRNGNYLLHKICKAAVNNEIIALFNPKQSMQIGHAYDYMSFVVDLMHGDSSGDFCISHAPILRLEEIVDLIKIETGYSKDVVYRVDGSLFRSPTLTSDSYKLRRSTTLPWNVSWMRQLISEIVQKYRSKS